MIQQPEIRLDYNQLVAEMQERFRSQGMFVVVRPEQALEKKIEPVLDAHANTFRGTLMRDWEQLFPGVPYSQEILNQEVDHFIAEKKAEAIAMLRKRLEMERKYRMIRGLLFGREQFNLLVVLVLSLFLIPFFLKVFFGNSDADLLFGAIGILSTLIVDSYFIFRYCKTKRT